MVEKPGQSNGNILKVTRADQYRTVSELFDKGQPNSVYYTLLGLSVLIIACGLLLNNAPIVIGGMLVTPMLTPILIIALGLAIGDIKATKKPLLLVIESILIVILGSFILGLIFGAPEEITIFGNTVPAALLYFIVALASGVAATFAWVRREVAEVLPGIAIAVSLVPPLALIGVWLSALDFIAARFYFGVFIFNFIGIVFGSIVVFLLLQFHKTKTVVEKVEKEVKELEENDK